MVWPQIKCCVLACAILSLLPALPAPAQDVPSKLGLATMYQREKSELIKRDLALKMIDSGLLKLYTTTAEDIAKIFGGDWMADVKVEKSQSYGIINFAKEPAGAAPDAQKPYFGWYMVVYYNTGDRKVFDWDLSNVHK